MFQVLLPVDSNEERALKAAEVVATLPNADEIVQVTILNVQEKIEATDGERNRIRSEEWYDETNFPSSAEVTEEYLEKQGIDATMQRRHGDPKEIIIRVSDEINADRIVMSGRKRSPTGKVLFGSITQSILLNSDIPVVVSME